MVIMGLDHVDQFGDIVRHHEAGTIPPTVMWGACPTAVRPEPGAARPAHRVHVGEAAVSRSAAIRDNWDRLRDATRPARCCACGNATRPTSRRR